MSVEAGSQSRITCLAMYSTTLETSGAPIAAAVSRP